MLSSVDSTTTWIVAIQNKIVKNSIVIRPLLFSLIRIFEFSACCMLSSVDSTTTWKVAMAM